MHHRTSCSRFTPEEGDVGNSAHPDVGLHRSLLAEKRGPIRSVSGHRIVDHLHAKYPREFVTSECGNSTRMADARVVPDMPGQKSARLHSIGIK